MKKPRPVIFTLSEDVCEIESIRLTTGERRVRPGTLPHCKLDAAGRAVVVRLLHRMRDDGTSVLLSSHALDALCEVASRVVHLSGGVLRETVPRDVGEDVDSFRRRVVAVRDGTAPSP